MTENIFRVSHDGWKTTTLGELCQLGGGDIQTGPFGSQLHASDYVPSGIPSVMPQNIGDNVIDEEGIARITAEDAARLSRYLLRTGDIVYSRRGDVERRALVRPAQDGWLCGTGCLRVRLGSMTDSRFLSYYLGHPDVREWIVRHAIGATMPNLNTRILSAVPVTIPPQSIQKAIGAALGALDDKMALNERAARIVEKLSSSLYRKVIETDSVYRSVASVADFRNHHRVPLSLKDRSEFSGPYPYYGANGVIDYVGNYIFDGDYVLVGEDGTVVTKEGKPVVRHARGKFWVSNHAHVLTGSEISNEMLHVALRNATVSSQITGAVQPKLSMGNLKLLTLKLPIPAVREALDERIRSLSILTHTFEEENRVLASLRDKLLPKLMSGELRVRDAEKVVEEAT